MARKRPGMRAALVQDLTIDNGVFNSVGPHHESASAAGQIVNRFPGTAGDSLIVKYHNVGREPGSKPSAVADPKKVRRLRRGSFDRQHLNESD